ncbi:MAG: GNAT family N-acetyltransferase [Sneathiella sp.]|uniref:GNAT family N-acetyltransferase n=1 Tax=Sneathiella sp. TaxID=1964365 RepID=UPI0030010EA7
MTFDQCPQDSMSCTQLSLTVLQSVEELIIHQEEWDGFVKTIGSDIYFLVDWLETWLQFYAKKCDLRCFIVRENGKVIAALPFCIEHLRIGFASIRIARIVGSYGTIAVFSPPVQPNCEAKVMRAVLSKLLSSDKCDAVCLSPISGINSLSTINSWNEILEDNFVLLEKKDVGVHTVFDLPETFDEYLRSLGKSKRKKYLKSNRLLSNEFDPESRMIENENALKSFEIFVDFHTKLWNRLGKLGHFGDWPLSLEFNRELVRKFAPTGHVKFYELSTGGRPLCLTFSFELGMTSYRRLSARDADPEMAPFSLGRVGYVKSLEILINDGKKFADTGPGHYEYKTALGGQEYQMKRLVFTRSGSRIVAKTRVYLKMSEWLHFVYYRVWFLKLSPKLRLKSRPLWAFWIKMKL